VCLKSRKKALTGPRQPQICNHPIYAYESFLLLLSNPKHPSCKKGVRPQKGHSEKRWEIQGGGQEMAVMVG